MIKDLENIEGDLSNNYQTLPVNFGENFAKKIISLFNIIRIFTKNEKKIQFIYYFMDGWG